MLGRSFLLSALLLFSGSCSLLVDQLEESEPDTLAIDAATNGDGAASDAMASSGEASTDGCSEVQPDGTCIIGD